MIFCRGMNACGAGKKEVNWTGRIIKTERRKRRSRVFARYMGAGTGMKRSRTWIVERKSVLYVRNMGSFYRRRKVIWWGMGVLGAGDGRARW